MTRHVSEQPFMQGLVGGLRLGEDRGVLSDADLSSLAAAKTAVDADVAKLHTSERMIGPKVKASLEKADQFLSSYTSGTDVSDYDVLPANVQYRGRTLVG
jgi:hypothetical protein